MTKFLICKSMLRDADILARDLASKHLINRRDEWKWIPTGRLFREKATGWYLYVLHGDVIVLGDYSKETFLERYVSGD